MPNKVPDGRPSTGSSGPTPGGPGPTPDRPAVPTGDSGGDVRPQPAPPASPTPGINLTGGDREEPPDLDAELLDIARMEDPDAGGEVFAQAQFLQTTPIDDGGEIATTSGLRLSLDDSTTPIDDGGEIATTSGLRLSFDDSATPIDDGGETHRKAGGDQPDVHSDPEGGGEIAFAARRTEVHDAHDRSALTEDPDAGGEVVEDPDGGGPVAMDGLHLLAQVNHLAAQEASDDLDTPPPPPPPPPPPQRAVAIDGESTRKDHTGELGILEDPDAGGEVDAAFGSGATPPRPVTMTADDLRADPDEGGELTEDPDAGGEIATRPPLDGIGIDDLTSTEDPDAGGEIVWRGEDDAVATPAEVETTYAEPEHNLVDLEVATDFGEASHTFDPE